MAQTQMLGKVAGFSMDAYALGLQQTRQRQLGGGVHPGLELLVPRSIGQSLQFIEYILLAHGARLAAFPQTAHDLVKRMSFNAKRQVQAQRDQRALGVVTHRRVGRVFVLTVVLDPGVKAGLSHRLHLPARRLCNHVDGFGQQLEIRCVVDQVGTAQQQVVVIAGKALKEPQQPRVVFLRVVVACKGIGAKLLDVPGVKVLVADQAQQGGVALACLVVSHAGKVAAVADQRGAVPVFQAAVTIAYCVEHEHVVFVWCLAARLRALAMPETDFGFADFLCVRQQSLAIERRQSPCHHKVVLNAASLEAAAPECTQLDGAIHQFIVIGGLVQAKTAFVGFDGCEPRGGLPAGLAFDRLQLQLVRDVFLSVYTQAQTGAVEKTALTVKPGGTHRVVKGIDLVAQCQRLTSLAVNLPAAFVQLLDRWLAASLFGVQPLQVLGKFAHQIAAGYPHWQRNDLLRIRLRNVQRDPKQVGVQVGGFNAVVQAVHVAPAARKQDKLAMRVSCKRMGSHAARPMAGQVRRSMR